MNLLNKLLTLPYGDKIVYAAGCFAAVVGLVHLGVPLWIAALVVATGGVLKEVYDCRHPDKHTADVMDIVADMVGVWTAVGVLSATVVQALL